MAVPAAGVRHADRLCRSNRHHRRGGRTDRHHHLGQRFRCFRHRGWQYDSKDEVSAYLTEYGHLPSNYITKKQAQALGWQGGSLEPYAPGCSIGGDRFGNYEGTLPDGSYHECDLNTRGADKRGAERLVYADDGRIYYTADHYESFEEITE